VSEVQPTGVGFVSQLPGQGHVKQAGWAQSSSALQSASSWQPATQVAGSWQPVESSQTLPAAQSLSVSQTVVVGFGSQFPGHGQVKQLGCEHCSSVAQSASSWQPATQLAGS